MKKRLIALALCCVTLFGLLAGCGGGNQPADNSATSPSSTENSAPANQPADNSSAPADSNEPVYGGTLKVSLNRTVSAKSLDPLYIDSTTADQIVQNFGDTLIRENSDGSEYLPNIATSWEISEDGLTYTFKIRTDVHFQPGKFQDGRLLTSEDVAYTLNHAKDYWCNYLYYLDYAEATDDETVVCHLMNPNATFMHELVHSSTIMVPKEEVEGWGEEFGMHPVSTGPFMVKEHVPDQYTKLVKNPNYWGVEPYLDGLEYYIITDAAQATNALMTGEIDVNLSVAGEAIQQVKDSPALTLCQTPEFRVAYFGFNMTNEYLANDKVREALIMAVDYEQLTAAQFTNGDGEVSYLPLPMTSWGYDKSLEDLVPKYDPEGAKALLAEAGYPNGFTLQMSCTSDEARLRAVTLLQAFWSQVGVNLEIRTLAQAEITASYLDNTVVTWASGQGGSADPATFVGNFFSTEKLHTNYNSFCYSDPYTDELIEKALVLTDQDARKEVYKEITTLGVEKNVGIFYATMNLSWGMSNKVHGYVQQNQVVFRVCGTEGSGINVWKEA